MTRTRRRANPRTLGALAGVLLIAAVAAAYFHSSAPGSPAGGLFLRNGPLTTDGQDVEGAPATPGVQIAYAGLTLYNTGTKPIVLESARLYPAPRGMRQLAGFAVPPGRTLNAIEFVPWPRQSDTRVSQDIQRARPIRGAVIRPTTLQPLEQGDEIFLVLRPSAGVHTAPYVYVRYRVGQTQYAERLPRGVIVCAMKHPSTAKACNRAPAQTIDAGSVLG